MNHKNIFVSVLVEETYTILENKKGIGCMQLGVDGMQN